MTPEIKFCGLTRPEDAEHAARIGASYVGVIFAGGPRRLSIEQATTVFERVPASVKRVGVFGSQSVEEILDAATRLTLNVVQLHLSADHTIVNALRRSFSGDIWTVCRIAGGVLPASLHESLEHSDGVLLDAYVPGAMGGTGVTLPWRDLAALLAEVRGTGRIILAGGLRPENVAEAVALLEPAAVDVSSGVESAPGIKDHQRMQAFRDAVAHASIST